MPEFDDNRLLTLLKQDSLDAYEILFKRYYKLLCLQANLLIYDEAEAEDVVQELFIEFWDKKIYKQVEQSLKAYLYRAVRNRCLNEIKKNRNIQQKLTGYYKFRSGVDEPSRTEHSELLQHIDHVLKDFPPQRLKAFTLVYLENKKYQKAADEMGVSINSVKTHLKMALQVLREKLEAFK